MTTKIHTPKIIMMLDIETLGQRVDAVVWQSALMAVDATDPETILSLSHHHYLAIQPQLDLGRRIDASTMLYWMRPELEKARENMLTECDSIDFDELTASLKHLVRAFDRYAEQAQGDWELWTRGNFDAPIMEALMMKCGIVCPWAKEFRKVRDLRTAEALSGVSFRDIPEPTGFIKHRADWDCVFQLSHLAAINRALGADKV